MWYINHLKIIKSIHNLVRMHRNLEKFERERFYKEAKREQGVTLLRIILTPHSSQH